MLFLFAPFGTIILLALPLSFIVVLTDWKPSLLLMIVAWGSLTFIVMTWCFIYDPELLTWTLTTTDLRRGKRWPKVIFRFDEVESVVVGVPARTPWILCWARFHPDFRTAWNQRCSSIFVRLRGGRRIPLNFLSGQFVGGLQLMERFLSLHEARVLGHDTYTEQELRKMQRADLNRIFSI